MTDNVVPIHNGPQKILERHLEMKPELSVCLSIKEGICTVDFSAPFTIGDLLLLHRLMGTQIDQLIFKGTR